jgi:hypothetical protein
MHFYKACFCARGALNTLSATSTEPVDILSQKYNRKQLN